MCPLTSVPAAAVAGGQTVDPGPLSTCLLSFSAYLIYPTCLLMSLPPPQTTCPPNQQNLSNNIKVDGFFSHNTVPPPPTRTGGGTVRGGNMFMTTA